MSSLLYISGDSYAVENGSAYSDAIRHKGIFDKVLNVSVNGSCNSRIFRVALRDLIEKKTQFSDISVIISLSFTIRTELWDTTHKENRFRSCNDGDFYSVQFATEKDWFKNLSFLNSNPVDQYKNGWLYYHNVESANTVLLQQIIMFTSWCKLNNIKYVIFSGPVVEPCDVHAPFIKPFADEVAKDNSVLDLFTFSFTQWCLSKGFLPIDDFTQEINGKTFVVGHHGPEAHLAFANFLVENNLI